MPVKFKSHSALRGRRRAKLASKSAWRPMKKSAIVPLLAHRAAEFLAFSFLPSPAPCLLKPASYSGIMFIQQCGLTTRRVARNSRGEQQMATLQMFGLWLTRELWLLVLDKRLAVNTGHSKVWTRCAWGQMFVVTGATEWCTSATNSTFYFL